MIIYIYIRRVCFVNCFFFHPGVFGAHFGNFCTIMLMSSTWYNERITNLFAKFVSDFDQTESYFFRSFSLSLSECMLLFSIVISPIWIKLKLTRRNGDSVMNRRVPQRKRD